MSSTVGVAVLGIDHWYNLLPFLDQVGTSDGFELMVIADPDEQRGRALAAEHGASWTAGSEEALQTAGVTLAAVFSSTDRTAALVGKAAASGKHVLCNKPLGMTLAEADHAVAAVEDSGVTYFPYESYARITAPMRAMKRAIDRGMVGELWAIRCIHEAAVPRTWSDDQSPGWWTSSARSPGGGWIDHSIYQLDIARWLTGSEPGSVSGSFGTLRHHGFDVEDYGIAAYRFDNGVVVTSEAHWLAPDGAFRRTVEVTGTEGVLIFDSTADSIRLFGKHDRLPEGGDSDIVPSDRKGWHEAPLPQTEAAGLLRHLEGVLQRGEIAVGSIHDSRANLASCLDFYASATRLA